MRVLGWPLHPAHLHQEVCVLLTLRSAGSWDKTVTLEHNSLWFIAVVADVIVTLINSRFNCSVNAHSCAVLCFKTGPEWVQTLPVCLLLTDYHRTEGCTAAEEESIAHLTVWLQEQPLSNPGTLYPGESKPFSEYVRQILKRNNATFFSCI